MRFEKRDISRIKFGYSKATNLKLLEDFKKSGFDCAEVLDIGSKNPEYFVTSINDTVRRLKEEFVGIKAHFRKGKIYLVNHNLIEDLK